MLLSSSLHEKSYQNLTREKHAAQYAPDSRALVAEIHVGKELWSRTLNIGHIAVYNFDRKRFLLILLSFKTMLSRSTSSFLMPLIQPLLAHDIVQICHRPKLSLRALSLSTLTLSALSISTVHSVSACSRLAHSHSKDSHSAHSHSVHSYSARSHSAHS